MKKIYLVRHAKSSWENANMSDFDRPLNDRGEKDAPEMGRRLRDRGIKPDLMVTSPAVRAGTTCEIITYVMGLFPDKIQDDQRIYLAEENQLLTVVKEWTAGNSVMMFGHNPGLTRFANLLCNGEILNIPTCGVVAITMDIQEWSNTKWGCGEMEFFDFPRNLNSD